MRNYIYPFCVSVTNMKQFLMFIYSRVRNVPSKHLLVFKTSWRGLQGMPSTRLQHFFSVTIFRPPRRLEDVVKTSCKMSWRRLGRRKIVTLKTSWRHVLKTSWRHILKTSSRRLGGKQNVYWGYLYLTNLNVYIFDLTNLYLGKLNLMILRRIQNVLIRTQ